MLLHGFADSADCWRPVLTLLERAGRTAVAVDLVGFGAADSTRWGPLLPQWDEFVEAVVAQHGATSAVVLVGNSLGGLLTVRAAATVKGLPIRGVVAIDAAGTGWTPLVRAVIVQNLLLLTPLVALPVPPMVRRAGVTLVARIVLYGRWRSADPETIDSFAKGIRTRRDAQRLIAVARRTVGEVNAHGPFDGIDCATVVLHGRRDLLVSVDAARRLHRMIPGSRLVVLERSGHCPQLDAPERVAALAIELAATATPRRAGTA